MLRAESPSEELASVLEVLSTLEPDPEAKRAVLRRGRRAGVRSAGRSGACHQELSSEARHRVPRPRGRGRPVPRTRGGQSLGRAHHRARVCAPRCASDPAASHADRVRIAKIYAEIKREPHSAIAAWRRVRELHGREVENFGALLGAARVRAAVRRARRARRGRGLSRT